MTEKFEYFQNEPNLEVIKYSYSEMKMNHYCILDHGTGICGFGGHADPTIAQKKALFELIERTVFHKYGAKLTETSSGWAAHQNLIEAKKNSLLELYERDAVLCSWLAKVPPEVLGNIKLPIFRKSVKILKFGYGANFSVIGMLLERPDRNARMLISTAADYENDAIDKLVVDAERAFYLMEDIRNLGKEPVQAHAVAISDALESDLNWIICGGKGILYDKIIPTQKIFLVPLWNGTLGYVVGSWTPNLQALYYGSQHLRYISRHRLKTFLKGRIRLNRIPHPIL